VIQQKLLRHRRFDSCRGGHVDFRCFNVRDLTRMCCPSELSIANRAKLPPMRRTTTHVGLNRRLAFLRRWDAISAGRKEDAPLAHVELG
jgi:hypothetical protein